MNALSKYRSTPGTKSLFDSFIEDFFNGDISNFIGSDSAAFQPAVNISETDQEFLIDVAAPGFEKTDFELKIEGDQLNIRGTHEVSGEKTDRKFTRREFYKGAFLRSFTVPDNVNKNELSAVYENGVLRVRLPKSADAKPMIRTIEIGG